MSDCGLMFINEQRWGDVNEAPQRCRFNKVRRSNDEWIRRHSTHNIEEHYPFPVDLFHRHYGDEFSR